GVYSVDRRLEALDLPLVLRPENLHDGVFNGKNILSPGGKINGAGRAAAAGGNMFHQFRILATIQQRPD
ncbi:MAG: hypothetical protein ACOC8N_06555, partial [Spirochaetota bacterium]